ncbi:unnamed protein product [Penicillium glandicola]
MVNVESSVVTEAAASVGVVVAVVYLFADLAAALVDALSKEAVEVVVVLVPLGLVTVGTEKMTAVNRQPRPIFAQSL